MSETIGLKTCNPNRGVALSRETIFNRTYGRRKPQYVSPRLLTVFDPIHYGLPEQVDRQNVGRNVLPLS